MLILQRKAGESLVIGDDITVSVVSVENGRVRLAITAPSEVPILRSELIIATAANVDSANTSEPDELIGLLGSVAGQKKDGGSEEKKDVPQPQ